MSGGAMAGWALAGFLVGFLVGAVYGLNIQRREAVKAVERATARLTALAEAFASSLDETKAAVFMAEAKNIVKLDDYRPPKKTRPF